MLVDFEAKLVGNAQMLVLAVVEVLVDNPVFWTIYEQVGVIGQV